MWTDSAFWHFRAAIASLSALAASAHYFPCSPAHPGSWRISRWIMGCRVFAQVALITFLCLALLREENPLRVASFKFGLSLGLNHWVMYYVSFLSWFLAFIFSMCGIWARHIVLRFEPVLFVLCSVIEIIVLICLFSPSSIIAFSHACFKFRSVRVIYWNRR